MSCTYSYLILELCSLFQLLSAIRSHFRKWEKRFPLALEVPISKHSKAEHFPSRQYINRCVTWAAFPVSFRFGFFYCGFLFVLQFSSIILMQQICWRIRTSRTKNFREFATFRPKYFYDFYFCHFTTHTEEENEWNCVMCWVGGCWCCKLKETSLTCHKKSIKIAATKAERGNDESREWNVERKVK